MDRDLSARMDRFAPFDPRHQSDDYSIASDVANGTKATPDDVRREESMRREAEALRLDDSRYAQLLEESLDRQRELQRKQSVDSFKMVGQSDVPVAPLLVNVTPLPFG